MNDHIEVLRQLLREAVPYLRDAGEPFEDDGSNEPLELSRRIEDALESDAALAAMGGQGEGRPCTCPPDDSPPSPCPRRYALSECRKAAQQPEALSPGGTVEATRDDELPGMWSASDFTGGRDYEQPEAQAGGVVAWLKKGDPYAVLAKNPANAPIMLAAGYRPLIYGDTTPPPTEEEVLAAAKRAAAANSSMHEGCDLELFWRFLDDRAQEHWLKVARAALGVGQP